MYSFGWIQVLALFAFQAKVTLGLMMHIGFLTLSPQMWSFSNLAAKWRFWFLTGIYQFQVPWADTRKAEKTLNKTSVPAQFIAEFSQDEALDVEWWLCYCPFVLAIPGCAGALATGDPSRPLFHRISDILIVSCHWLLSACLCFAQASLLKTRLVPSTAITSSSLSPSSASTSWTALPTICNHGS